MHPLTKLIVEGHNYGTKDMDRVITTYLRDRAEWLKNSMFKPGYESHSGKIDQAFELEAEKCEQCENPMQKGMHTCKPKPTLPSKFEIYGKGKYDPETHWRVAFQEAFNQIIDYLKAKQ